MWRSSFFIIIFFMKYNRSNSKQLNTGIFIIESEEDSCHYLSQTPKIDFKAQSRQRSRMHQKTRYRRKNPAHQCIDISSDSDKISNSKDSKQKKKNKKLQICQISGQNFPWKRNSILKKKYKVVRLIGEGAFGKVVEAEFNGNFFAIKILKPSTKSIQNGDQQMRIIKYLNDKDKKDSYGIVKLIQSFTIKQYYCLVFQSLGKNLYDIMKLNRMQGFQVKEIQIFFKQILTSINFLHRCGYTHTDLKPQNIVLVDKQLVFSLNNPSELQGQMMAKPVSLKIKIIDFGNAVIDDERYINVINTRQYRSPEVILESCNWNKSNDVWAIGCIIIELLRGSLLFSIKQDVQHLMQIQSFCGKYPKWMHNRSPKYSHLFQTNGLMINSGGLVNELKLKKIKNIDAQLQSHPQLRDLLHKCLQIDPKRRISCDQALEHEFFSIKY